MLQQSQKHSNWFEANPRKTIGLTVAVLIFVVLLLTELTLRYIIGLGNPVLYDSNPLYGFRLLPNQKVTRFYGSTIKVNNLGLRENDDWDERIDNKILFLGNSVTYGGSYISNEELFSDLAVRDLPDYQGGNAGVNGWGVENIYGLIVETRFLPAKIYVTVLVEEDFYRGLTRLQGQPYWCVKPSLAIKELLYTYYFFEMNKRYIHWQKFASGKTEEMVIEKGVVALKKINDYLVANDRIHLIYISPTKFQVLGLHGKDDVVFRLLQKHHLNISYMVDRISALNLSDKNKISLFHDSMHLEKAGHAVWAKIIEVDLMKLSLIHP